MTTRQEQLKALEKELSSLSSEVQSIAREEADRAADAYRQGQPDTGPISQERKGELIRRIEEVLKEAQGVLGSP